MKEKIFFLSFSQTECPIVVFVIQRRVGRGKYLITLTEDSCHNLDLSLSLPQSLTLLFSLLWMYIPLGFLFGKWEAF